LSSRVSSVEELYLGVRYPCEALRIKLRRTGQREAAERLGSVLRGLCAELRAYLARQGRDRVSSTFDPRFLERPIESLREECLASARRLARATGSSAAVMILEVLGG